MRLPSDYPWCYLSIGWNQQGALEPMKNLGIISSSTRNPLRFANDQQPCDHRRLSMVLSFDRLQGFVLNRRSLRALAINKHPPLFSSDGRGIGDEHRDSIFFGAQSPPYADNQQSCDHHWIYTVLSLGRVESAMVLRLAGAL
ncbi:hypothetical protein FIBSPDRAFT_423243 [Athelia psychrophila]|uniref:Uncharacterized protein n=1 Tax=Athelia psychrophila TaxID=1759441 RepID=A0A166MY39_9AGAM|nr:hypothetical protein FIBSPDRAFT_423243 [Fibularhizoctonia sp. CBS 109695]